VTDLPDDPNGAPDLPNLPDLGDLDGGALGGLLEQAQQMMAAQAEAAEREVEGAAGGGVVRIRAMGDGQIIGVTIAPEVVDPDDVSLLEDLVLAALHDVHTRLAEIQRDAMGPLGGLLGGG
jgi:nucleoid-associated protein EbfC